MKTDARPEEAPASVTIAYSPYEMAAIHGIRGDFGFPVTAGALPPDVTPMAFYFSFGQAFRTRHMVSPFGP